ncbi:hypothetical protein BDV26DRAFT_263810, partial [Aspergillus bertholletiae]
STFCFYPSLESRCYGYNLYSLLGFQIIGIPIFVHQRDKFQRLDLFEGISCPLTEHI